MQDILQPIIHKTPIVGLRVNVAQSGLCIGDTAQLGRLDNGRIGIFAQASRRLFGIFPHRAVTCLGSLTDEAEQRIATALDTGGTLRIRIVGLTPEHLSQEDGPQIHVSVWGNLAEALSFHRSDKIR
jgi:hypothetical protein